MEKGYNHSECKCLANCQEFIYTTDSEVFKLDGKNLCSYEKMRTREFPDESLSNQKIALVKSINPNHGFDLGALVGEKIR